MKKIVVVGGGFAGLSFALSLRQKFAKSIFDICVIDKRKSHLFTPNLYEVAASEEEFQSFVQIRDSIAIPYKNILKGKKIDFVEGEAQRVVASENILKLKNRDIKYDYLILALGSQADFFGIPGAEKYGLPMKSLADALRIRNAVEFAVQSHRHDVIKSGITIVVAGGGYTGVELAGELARLKRILSWKYNYPEHKIKIEIVEAQNQLMSGFDNRLSRDAFERLGDLGVNIRLLSPIEEVQSQFVRMLSGEVMQYDVLVWTAGVKAASLPTEGEVLKDRKGRIETNEFLQIKNRHNIFVIGDECCMLDENGRAIGGSAQDAMRQGRYLAKVFPKIINNQAPDAYSCRRHGFIVTIGGKWAILSNGKYYLKGWLGYIFSKLAHFRYYLSILGLFGALGMLSRELEFFERND